MEHSRKRFVIAGHCENAPGALAYTGSYEHFYTTKLQRKIMRYFDILKSRAQLIDLEGSVITDPEHKDLSRVIQMINETPTTEGDFGIDIHFNPDFKSATGTEVFVHPQTTSENKERAIKLVNETSRILNIPVRRAASQRDYKYPSESNLGTLGIIEKTNIPMILWEVCFMTESDLSKFLGREFTIAHMVAYKIL